MLFFRLEKLEKDDEGEAFSGESEKNEVHWMDSMHMKDMKAPTLVFKQFFVGGC